MRIRKVIEILFKRYIRLAGVLAFFLFVLAVQRFLPLVSYSGPVDQALAILNQDCMENWWSVLLMINNIYPYPTPSCMAWTWYTANDWQFFIVACFLVLIYL